MGKLAFSCNCSSNSSLWLSAVSAYDVYVKYCVKKKPPHLRKVYDALYISRLDFSPLRVAVRECCWLRVCRNIAFFDKSILKGLSYRNVLWGTGLFFSVSVQLYVCRINMFCKRLVTRIVPCGSEKICVYLKQVRERLRNSVCINWAAFTGYETIW